MANGARPDQQGEVLERPDERTDEPERWGVYLLNDDYTTMDFVVEVLEGIFLKSPAEAHRVMMQVHQAGKGLAGIYTHEVAETKVAATVEAARANGFPLQAVMEQE